MTIRDIDSSQPPEGPQPTLLDWDPEAEVHPLAPDEVRVWVVELDSGIVGEAEVNALEPGPELAILSEDERARAARFVRARERQRFARCRAALRRILGGLRDESPESLRFRAARWASPSSIPAPDRRANRRCSSTSRIRPTWR